MEEEINYGIKKKGETGFIVVAPHAAGDDTRTGELSEKIAKQLKAFLVVNRKYVKRTNSKARIKPVRDFNRLPLKNGVYRWGEKKGSKHMKEFYDDISEFMRNIFNKHRYNKAIIVFIHGMKDGKDKIDIDIGCGARYYRGRLEETRKHPEARSNTGVFRANRKYMENLKKALSKFDLKIGIGEAERIDKYGKKIQFAAWSKINGIQYFAGTRSHSFQLEIAFKFRKRNRLEYTSKIISKALKSVYKESC